MKQSNLEKFPIYKDVIESFTKTPEGIDLYGILRKDDPKIPGGYKLVNTNKFYLSVRSRTYISALPDGRWYYTVLSDGKRFSEEYFDSMIPALREVWIKVILKGVPRGISKAKFKEWIIKNSELLYGKGYSLDRIYEIFFREYKDLFYLTSERNVFNNERWDWIFKLLGGSIGVSADGLGRPILSISPLVNYKDPKIYRNVSYDNTELLGILIKNEGFVRMDQEIFAHLLNRENITITASPVAKPTKECQDFLNRGTLNFRIGVKTKEEFEEFIIDKVIDTLKTSPVIAASKPGDPLILFIIALLEYGLHGKLDTFEAIPEVLIILPEPLKSEISKGLKLTAANMETLEYAKSFGLIR